MQVADDPYFARHREKSIKPADTPPVTAWLSVYIVNLIFPLWIGWWTTQGVSKIGMFLGIVAVFALGYRLCSIARRVMLPVIYGGCIVAVFQLVPMLHIFAGLCGVSAAHVFEDVTKYDQVNTMFGGFLATVVTGGILILVAAAPGLVIQWFMSVHPNNKFISVKALAKEIEVIGR